MRFKPILFALILALTAFSASAFDRIIPAKAKRGLISFERYPTVLLDGKPCPTSAGLRIYNQQNMTQVTSSLAGYKFEAKYTVDTMWQIDRIWILTAKEIKQSPRKKK